MSWYITGKERRLCPPEFQQVVTEKFGLNRFGNPNYKIVWGETETFTMLSADGTHYRKKLLCNGVPCWNVLRWRAPELWGTPELYYAMCADPQTGLCLLGEFPYEGAYEVALSLTTKEFVGKELIVHSPPLDYWILDVAIQLLHMSEIATDEEKQAAVEAEEAREERELVNEIAETLMEDLPTHYGPTSYGNQGFKSSHLADKMAQIQRVWDKMSASALRKPMRGFYQGQPA